jgi:CheY-like chemotaxis protein
MLSQGLTAMHADDIYELTMAGQSELRSSATTLSAAELALLIRFDGNLTLRQLQASLSPAARNSFDADFSTLRGRGVIAPLELDPFSSRFHAEVGNFAALVGDPEADAAMASLRRSGFFVQIARERNDVRLPAPGEPLSVLVVEDDPLLARFVESYLKLSGMRVRTAADRAGIVSGLREKPLPHLVLLDVTLPDVDGFDILLRMRQHPALKRVPVVMLTGKATRQAVIKGLTTGADGYLTKPFEPDSVIRAVRTVLGLSEKASGDSANDLWVNPDAKPVRSTRETSSAHPHR